MELTNPIIANMLKLQLLNIYEKYTASPELLQDPIVSVIYDLIVKVKSVDDFRQWRMAVFDMDLGYDCINGIERKDNVMGRHDDLAVAASNESIAEFVAWKRNVTPESWGQARMLNRMTIDKIKAAVSGGFDAHIVLFRYCDKWAAIGADADRLFELFGWQTGYVNDDDDFISWMFVSKYGMRVLKESDYTVKILDLGRLDVISVAFTEDLLAASQQYFDYIRYVTRDCDEICKTLQQESDIIFDNAALMMQDSVKYIGATPGRISANLKSGKNLTLAEGHDWRCDNEASPILVNFMAHRKHVTD